MLPRPIEHATPDLNDQGRAALFVGHPGHELRVHAWLQRRRPLVFVLTDGSGSTGASRLASTTALLSAAGARPATVYGRFSDRETYQALLAGRHERLWGIAEEVADGLVAAEIDCLAADAAEGFNPTHDVCRLLADAAVELARRRAGLPLASFEFALDGHPRTGSGGTALRLTPDEVAAKFVAARGYSELSGEVESALARYGAAAFEAEVLYPRDRQAAPIPGELAAPAYERWGKLRVQSGRYDQVLRYREHVAPLVAYVKGRLAAAAAA